MRPPDGLRGVITDDGDGDDGAVIPLLAPRTAAGDIVDVVDDDDADDDGRRM